MIKDLFTLWFTISLVFALIPVVESFFSLFPGGCCILAFENSSISSHWFLPLIPPPILLQSLDSHLTFLSLVFRVLAPHSPSIPTSGVFPILCKDQTQNFPASSVCLSLISFLCSVAWRARGPCSLCAKAVYRHLQDFPCHQTPWMACSWFSADCTNIEVLKWIQFPSAWMA